MIKDAASSFNGELNDYLENVRKQHEQIIDAVNIDMVTKSEWDTASIDKAKKIIKDFTDYMEKNRDEIKALEIFYNQPHNRKNITFKMIREVFEKLKTDKPVLAPSYVWDAFDAVEKVKTSCPEDQLTALVSLIRRVCGIDSSLKAYDKTMDENFKNWIFRQNAGKHNRFSPEQMEWLRMLKEHVISSYHLEVDDLDFTPFDARGGRGKMYQLFGRDMDGIIDKLNEVLAA